MIALALTALSAAAFYLSLNLGEVWPLAWLAPMPVLYLAYSNTRPLTVFLGAFAAYALGALNLLEAYGSTFPLPVMALALGGPALCFSLAVMTSRWIANRLSWPAGLLAFPAMWTLIDYALSAGPDGTAPSPAYSQVAATPLIQIASITGLWGITFLIGFVAAGLAMAIARNRVAPGLLALIAFCANAGFGVWRIETAQPAQPVAVGLAVDDSQNRASFANDEATATAAVASYAKASRALAAQGAKLIVLPEKVAILTPAWRDRLLAMLTETARTTNTRIVAGFDERGPTRLNVAYAFTEDGLPRRYTKRRLLGATESAFAPGSEPMLLVADTGIAICKDMDFPGMLSRDSAAAHPMIVAVPAWDFGRDAWAHGRMAILRGVENGFAVARAAKEGFATLTDAYGRIVAIKRSEPNTPILVRAALARGPGITPYQKVGDILPVFCFVFLLALLRTYQRSTVHLNSPEESQ